MERKKIDGLIHALITDPAYIQTHMTREYAEQLLEFFQDETNPLAAAKNYIDNFPADPEPHVNNEEYEIFVQYLDREKRVYFVHSSYSILELKQMIRNRIGGPGAYPCFSTDLTKRKKTSVLVSITDSVKSDLLGKIINFDGVTENTTLYEFANKFFPQLGYDCICGSLCTESSPVKIQFSFKYKEFKAFPPLDFNLCDSTFNYSTMISCKLTKLYRVPLSDTPECLFLTFQGSMLDDNRSLCECGVTKGVTVVAGERMQGGGGEIFQPLAFVDVSSDRLVKIPVSSKAPSYRKFCKGLTMEGKCENAKCTAYKKDILSMEGYKTYRLGKDISTCPSCSERIVPIRPLYYKCVVEYNGIKDDGTRIVSPPKKFDEVQSFDVKEAGTTGYKFLFIKVGKPEDLAEDSTTGAPVIVTPLCHICHADLASKSCLFPGFCGHAFHKNCIDKWKSVNSRCPLCSLDFSGI